MTWHEGCCALKILGGERWCSGHIVGKDGASPKSTMDINKFLTVVNTGASMIAYRVGKVDDNKTTWTTQNISRFKIVMQDTCLVQREKISPNLLSNAHP